MTTAFARLPLLAKLTLGGLAAGMAALTLRLWPEWQRNPDLSHGFFMPVVFLWVLYEARSRAGHYLPRHPATQAALGLLLVGGLLALVAAGLYAAAVDWSHALVNFMLAGSLVAFLGAGLVALSAESIRFIPFNWSGIVAILLWLLCVPIPPGTYMRLTLTLQLWVSEATLRCLHILGVAAIRQGNIIHLANTTVGVEEACSGVRSLISCVFAGLLFSATLVQRPWARVLIIALAAPLALAMNFVRAMTLTLLSNNGVDITGTWHDATGFAVLGVTAAILGALALFLERPDKKSAPAPAQETTPRRRQPQLVALVSSLAVASVLVAFFVANTRPSPRRDAPVPDLFALLPSAPTGWQVLTSDLFQFRDTLHTEHLAQRRYAKETPTGRIEVTLYVAYWQAGQVPVSLVASHTPEACWPGSGWTMMRTADARAQLKSGPRALPAAEYRFFQETDGFPQHVWFWHLYDGAPISYRDPYSPTELLRIALQYGFRHDGDQLFVRASSNRPWSDIANEPFMADFFGRMQPLGL